MGTNWSGPELLCNSTLEPDHPILQQCIRKGGMMDVPPDGVLVVYTWHMTEAGSNHWGTKPCDGLVPPPATLLQH